MQKTSILIPVMLLLLGSCAKEIEFCVDGNMNPAEPGTYTYTWCGANADNIEWNFTNTATIYSGESITLEFNQKTTYGLNVTASNKKKEVYQTFTFDLSNYEARVEPKDCNNDYVGWISGTSLRTYLYADLTSLQIDLRNDNKNNCIDSITLGLSDFYQGTTDHGSLPDAYVGGFQNVTSGSYVVYVAEVGATYPMTNILDLLVYGGSLQINNGGGDDLCNPILSNLGGDYITTLISETYLLTDVWVNSVNTGVPTCNADDVILFNLDGSWSHDVGSDDCSGAQTSSLGTYTGVGTCTDLSSSSLWLTATSGSFNSATAISISFLSSTQIMLSMTDGGNSIQQEYTVQ